jgi:diguanylate cyclase (GGDEF)-like protein
MKYSRLFIFLTLLLVTGLIAVTGWVRIQEFERYQVQLAQRAVDGTAAAIANLVQERRRQVTHFAADQQEFIRLLAADPANESLRKILTDRISIFFPEHFTFTIADRSGTVLVADKNMVPGELCLEDLKSVIDGKPQKIRLHPNPTQTHFDIVAPWGDADAGGLFFISFDVTELVKLLGLALPPQQSLLLIHGEMDGLIELSHEGARNELSRETMRLTAEEKERIVYVKPIEGTVWQLADFFEPELIAEQTRRVLLNSSLILSAFIIYSLVTFILVRNQEQQRSRAEDALRNWKLLLEQSNRELKQLAVTDELTGISNRRYFYDQSAVELKRARRNWTPMSVILIDVDKFKDFNDTYGHKAGDECLQAVALAISEVLKRPTDIVARYGGEEFIAALPETPLVGAEQIADAIRTAVEDLEIPHKSSDVTNVVTVSLGVCCADPDSNLELDELINRADAALYQAKSAGRNRVMKCEST